MLICERRFGQATLNCAKGLFVTQTVRGLGVCRFTYSDGPLLGPRRGKAPGPRCIVRDDALDTTRPRLGKRAMACCASS
jgi:hypothetical protein